MRSPPPTSQMILTGGIIRGWTLRVALARSVQSAAQLLGSRFLARVRRQVPLSATRLGCRSPARSAHVVQLASPIGPLRRHKGALGAVYPRDIDTTVNAARATWALCGEQRLAALPKSEEFGPPEQLAHTHHTAPQSRCRHRGWEGIVSGRSRSRRSLDQANQASWVGGEGRNRSGKRWASREAFWWKGRRREEEPSAQARCCEITPTDDLSAVEPPPPPT